MKYETHLILWLIAMYVATRCVFTFVGLRYMVQMYPEGNRWYIFPLQLVSLAVFAITVLYHPF